MHCQLLSSSLKIWSQADRDIGQEEEGQGDDSIRVCHRNDQEGGDHNRTTTEVVSILEDRSLTRIQQEANLQERVVEEG